MSGQIELITQAQAAEMVQQVKTHFQNCVTLLAAILPSKKKDEQATHEQASPPKANVDIRPGVPYAEVIDGFKLDSTWHEKLRKTSRRGAYQGAVMQLGKRGEKGGARFNPAKVAELLVSQPATS